MAFPYAVFLDLLDVPVLLVGGGTVAVRKATALVEAGARVTVVAPVVQPELVAMVAEVQVRPYERGEVAAYQLVITATDDPAVNAAVSRDAVLAKVWVNSADDPEHCSFILPAIARQGPITVAVSTGGASPALARELRRRVAEQVLTPEAGAAAVELARQRAEIHAAGASTESVDWTDRVRAALDGSTAPGT
ncbi:MAG: bifunctional precorrin-2 dehydrogenase/sirohydrochlorin ferrochelatase [Ilumatobacteraceae bacterium]